jgi:hypothetical protein
VVFVVAIHPQELDLCVFRQVRDGIHELLSTLKVCPESEVAYRDDVRAVVLACVLEYPLRVVGVAVYVARKKDTLIQLFWI